MKLVVLSLTHNTIGHRRDIFKFFLRRMSRIKDKFGIEMLVVGSDGEMSHDMTTESGFLYLEHPNKPVSFKWNAGFREVKKLKPDYVMTLDSDDFLCDRLFGEYLEHISTGEYGQIGVGDSYFCSFHLKRAHFDKCFYWPGYKGGNVIMGCSRVVRSDILDCVDWRPYPYGKNASLNGLFHSHISKHSTVNAPKKVIGVYGGNYLHIDVKTNGNISSVAPLWKHRPLLDFNKLMSDHLPYDEALSFALWREAKIKQYESRRK